MERRLRILHITVMMSLVSVVYGQTAGPDVSAQGAVIDQFCVTCHSQRARTAGLDSARKLTLDNFDLAHVRQNAEVAEKVVRKLRAGMMPPPGIKRPDPGTIKALVAW